MSMNGDGRWRATHGRTPRSEADPASRTRMWRPTVISRELAPLNTATVPPVCDRASDPYQELNVGVRLRQAAARQANNVLVLGEDAGRSLGSRALGARSSTAPRSNSGPTVISSQKRLGRKPHDRGTRVVERRTAAGAPATRAESSSRTSPAPERWGRAPASLSRKSFHVARTPSGSSLARRYHRLRPRINHPGEHPPKLMTSGTPAPMMSRFMNRSIRGTRTHRPRQSLRRLTSATKSAVSGDPGGLLATASRGPHKASRKRWRRSRTPNGDTQASDARRTAPHSSCTRSRSAACSTTPGRPTT